MQPSARELWVAFFIILVISGIYLVAVFLLGGIPAASDFFGHSLGILGFLLMLMTETLYTMRKRSRSARWGRVSSWLQFHIVTGIVGPFMVLLHSSWKFNGLAGVVLLMTGVIVLSGFIGRYIYTAIPRNADGLELEADELHQQIMALESAIATWSGEISGDADALPDYAATPEPAEFHPSRKPSEPITQRINVWNNQRTLDPQTREKTATIDKLVKRHRTLERQRASLAQARRLMALWHTLHVPLGLALFAAAFIHIGAAIYYATLLR
jgi:hypothetical protein